MFVFILILFVAAWWFLWKKKYYVLIEDAGENADGIVTVVKTQLETSLSGAEAVLKSLPKLVRGGNLLNAWTIVKEIRKAGGKAKITWHFAFSNPLKDEEPKDKDGKKRPDSDARHSNGAYDFTPEEREEFSKPQPDHKKAYEKLIEAIDAGGEQIYPKTKEQTERMDALLDESERASEGLEDEKYHEILNEMRGIVGWSSRRHFNFSWLIILGSLLTIGFVWWRSNSKNENKKYAEERVARVEAWAETDTLTLERASEIVNYTMEYQSPNLYRAWNISLRNSDIKSCTERIESYKLSKDTASTAEAKQHYQECIEDNQQRIERYKSERAEFEAMSVKDAKKAALKETKDHLKYASKSARRAKIWMIIFFLLVPLYIFANYSWGYVITRTRLESKILGKVNTISWAIAGGMFGLGSAIPLFRDDSNGSNAANAVLLAIKALLIIGAIILIAVVSLFIMIYSTIVGLRRNYDWKEIIANVKGLKTAK